VIALSCGIKISAVRHLVLSQTDRITTPKTALAYACTVNIPANLDRGLRKGQTNGTGKI